MQCAAAAKLTKRRGNANETELHFAVDRLKIDFYMPFDRGERIYAVHLHMFYRLTDSDRTESKKWIKKSTAIEL